MICPGCNKQIKDSTKFCPWCGLGIPQQYEENSSYFSNEKFKFQTGFILLITFFLIVLFIVFFKSQVKVSSRSISETRESIPLAEQPIQKIADRWGIITPCYIICTSACFTEDEAIRRSYQLRRKGYRTGYLWIPDYPSLSGARMFVIYTGPFSSRSKCIEELRKYQRIDRKAYAVLVSHKSKRIDIR